MAGRKIKVSCETEDALTFWSLISIAHMINQATEKKDLENIKPVASNIVDNLKGREIQMEILDAVIP